jgi:hypothetical protein
VFCRYDRRKRYKEKNWPVTHHRYIQEWEHRQRVMVADTPLHKQHTFNEYL